MSSPFGFVVLGAGRGGTSLLAALLDSHTQLHVGFERFAHDCLLAEALPAGAASGFRARSEGFYNACEQAAINECKALDGPRIWGNKITTEQLAHLGEGVSPFPAQPGEELPRFIDGVLAKQKLIFILRDGRTCVRSKMARTEQSLASACDRWRYAVGVYDFLRDHPRALCLRYESLLRSPEVVLGEACDLLGVAFEPGMLAGTRHPLMNPDYRHEGLAVNKLDLEGVPDGCEQALAAELRATGYVATS